MYADLGCHDAAPPRHNRRKRRLGVDNRINARLGRVDKRHGHEIQLLLYGHVR